MAKNKKIILILLAIAVVLFLYLVLSTEKVVIFNSGSEKTESPKMSPEEITQEYNTGINSFFSNLESLTADDLSEDSVMAMKDDLLKMTVPEGKKDFHLNLVLGLDELLKKIEAGQGAGEELEQIKSMKASS